MTSATTLPFGSWPSPVSLDLVLGAARSVAEPVLDGDSVYLLELRPDEGGRAVVRRVDPDGVAVDVTPPGTNVRSGVHEYGGGSWCVRDGQVVYSTFPDGYLHVIPPRGGPATVVAEDGLRFADLEPDPARGRVLAVCEDHTVDDHDPANTLVAVDLGTGARTLLAGGHDFVSDPRLDADGRRLCWLTWDRPDMPWDSTQLWVAELDAEGLPGQPVLVAGGAGESVAAPRWAPDGSLVLVSDRSGWWNPYRWTPGVEGLVPLAALEVEFAGPAWVFGLRSLAPLADGSVLAVGRAGGTDTLYQLQEGSEPRVFDLPATDLEYLSAASGRAVVLAHRPTEPSAVLAVDLGSGSAEQVYAASSLDLDRAYLSVPRHVEFPTAEGRTAFAFYYPPTNPAAQAPEGELPPLVVFSHGGPTSSTDARLLLRYQFFTSRGFAVVDVDYGGSTGYGREYRRRLDGRWGEVDLDDCTNAAVWLADQGLADRARLVIRGGSAGGYTTLCALAFRDVFAAGASYFGVGDLEGLARDTHKFESRYLDRLVAPYPEGVEVYRARSPLYHADGISAPLLVLQGTDDRVVPQAQADDIVAALVRNGVPHAYVLFEGEGHGFRDAANQRRAMEAELSFYAQVLGFELADPGEPIALVGLPAGGQA